MCVRACVRACVHVCVCVSVCVLPISIKVLKRSVMNADKKVG